MREPVRPPVSLSKLWWCINRFHRSIYNMYCRLYCRRPVLTCTQPIGMHMQFTCIRFIGWPGSSLLSRICYVACTSFPIYSAQFCEQLNGSAFSSFRIQAPHAILLQSRSCAFVNSSRSYCIFLLRYLTWLRNRLYTISLPLGTMAWCKKIWWDHVFVLKHAPNIRWRGRGLYWIRSCLQRRCP